jgi:hypothetical protein
MSMTNAKMEQVWKVLNQLGSCKHAKMAYAVGRNLNMLEGPMKALEKAKMRPVTPEEGETWDKTAEDWETRRQEIMLEDCVKDNEGEPIVNEGQYIFKNPAAIEQRLGQIKKTEFPEFYAAEKEKVEEYQELLEEEAEVEGFPYKIRWSFVKIDDEGNMVDLTTVQQAILMGVDMFKGEPSWMDEDDDEDEDEDEDEEAAAPAAAPTPIDAAK